MPSAAEPKTLLIADLEALLGDRFSRTPYDVEAHSHDESFHPPNPPVAVVFPTSTEEVSEIVKLCAASSTPVIPFGAGTAVEGHVQAVDGGISIDLSRMNALIDVSVDDLDCRVEAGMRRVALNERLEKHGLWSPVDPGADASLGGMAATGASGTTTVRYGTIRENVLGLTVVLPDGRVINTGGRARKSSAGYDLTKLMLGSEGTLGVITEVQLKLHPLPEAISAAVCPFETVSGAVGAVIEILQAGIPIARCELLDEASMGAVNAYAKFSYARKPTIFFEFHGTEASVAEQAELTKEIVAEHGAGEFRWSSHREEREALWHARHHGYYAVKALRPGSYGWVGDVCVPISRLAECIEATRQDVEQAGLTAPILGHVGDGNFHAIFLVDPNDPEEMARAKAANRRMIDRAIAMQGSCSGEHGIGLGKLDALVDQHGEAVEVMRAIKATLDPRGIMNPGKVFHPATTVV